MMKINHLVSAAVVCALAATLGLAAPLSQTTAVHAKPDAASPAITHLPAGTQPSPAPDAMATTPAGWMAVELPGPFEGYVENKDLTKGLDVKEGTPIRTAPKADAPVLTVAQRGDKTSITGIRGRWTQLSLERKLTGYIQTANTPAPVAAEVPPVAATPGPVTAPGQPVPASSLNEGSSTLPRQFAGIFVSTRAPFRPRRPYDWALDDNSGQRFAYLDVSKLLLTEQIESYIGRSVVVFGAAKPTPDGKSIVIQVESLQLTR